METSQKIHLFTQEVLQFSNKNHLNTNALKEYLATIHTATKIYSETLTNASKHFNGTIEKEYEDHRVPNCYQELSQIFFSYSSQQQEIATNLQNKIIETLDAFEKTFCEANNFIKEQVDIVKDSLVIQADPPFHRSQGLLETVLFKNAEMMPTKTVKNNFSLNPLSVSLILSLLNFSPLSIDKIQDSQGKLKTISQQYKDAIASDEKDQYKTVLESVFQAFSRAQMAKVKLVKDNLLYNIKASKYCSNSASEQSTDLDEWDLDDDEPRSRRTTIIWKNNYRPACSSLLKKSQHQSPILQMKASTTKSNGVIPSSNDLGTSFAGLLCFGNKDKTPEETRRKEIDQLVYYLTQEKKVQRLNISRQGSNNSSSAVEAPALIKDQSKLRSLLFCNSDKEYFLTQFTENTLPGKDSITCPHVWAGLKVIAHSLASGWKRIKAAGGEKSEEYLFSLTNFLLKFFTKKKNNQRRYLGALLRNKQIWQDKDHWETIAHQLLQRKTNQTNKMGSQGSYYSTIIETNEEDQQGQSPRGSLTSSQKKMKSEEENALKLTVIDEVNVNLLHFELDQLLAADILLYVAQSLRLEKFSYKTLEEITEKTRAAELSQRLNNPAYYHQQKSKKLGHLYALRLSLQFLDEQDLLNVIQVNKSWRNSLKKSAYKIMLQPMQLTSEDLDKRMKLWKVLLEVDKMNIEYVELLLQKEGLPAKDFENSKRVIELDVRRSYTSNNQVPRETMKRLLHKYLYSEGGKDYYQGMHQLVGFLYYLLRDEEMALKMFMALMKKHSGYVMENEFKNLKTLLHQFDKLVYFILPDLWAHLIKEKVTVFLFVLPWIITVFTSSNHAWATPHILKIWDILLLEGWRGFFKVGIHILKQYKEKILKSKFDEIMMFLNDAILVEFFDPANTPADTFEQAIQNVNIPKSLFKQLEQEYENSPKE